MQNTTQKAEAKALIAKSFRDVLTALGLDLEDGGVQETPNRVANMLVDETCRGLFDPPPKITLFDNDGQYTSMVVVRNIEVKSICEHHFQPFVGYAHIAYMPGAKIIGLSKFSSIVSFFARRPQVQERLTSEIFNFLVTVLGTEDIALVIQAQHFCMKLRGVEEPCADTVTSRLGGTFLHDETSRHEFYTQLALSHDYT